MHKEKDWQGFIHDGFGKRYLLFCFYFVLGDFDNADEYFEWYKQEFPDNIGDPVQQLCSALSLHRMGKDKKARYRLAELMLSNLYIIPYLLSYEIKKYDIWHGSNVEEPEYVDFIFDEIIEKINKLDLQWMDLSKHFISISK